MNEAITSISASIGQLVAAMAGIFGLLIWRSADFGTTLRAIGRIRRARRIVPLTPRLRLLRRFYRLRFMIFAVFAGCLATCLWSLFLSLKYGDWIFRGEPLDPGLLKILVDSISLNASNALQMSIVAYLLLFIEWVIDGVCQAYDLDESLAVLQTGGRVELAETRHFRLERYKDLLTLWQLRVRYCVDEEGDGSLASILEELGDADVNWAQFSTAVCGFRINSRKNANVARPVVKDK